MLYVYPPSHSLYTPRYTYLGLAIQSLLIKTPLAAPRITSKVDKLVDPVVFSTSIKMQLFLRAQNTHTLEVTGQETVGEIKVKLSIIVSTRLFDSTVT